MYEANGLTKQYLFILTYKRIGIFLACFVLFCVSAFFHNSYTYGVNKLLGFNTYRDVISENDFQIHIVDVGQGDAIMVRFPDGQTMLIDAGRESETHKLISYLQNVFFYGYDKMVFDYVVLTHSDSDHCGGMKEIYSLCQVNTSIRPLEYSTLSSCEESFNTHNALQNYNQSYADYIDCIYNEGSPIIYANKFINYKYYPNGYITSKDANEPYSVIFLTNNENYYSNSNSYSTAILINCNNKNFLFTGDANTTTFDEIDTALKMLGIQNITFYKASHHGSASDGSNRQKSLFEINPQYVSISVGKNNAYGHPHDDFLETLELLNIPTQNIYRTDTNGSTIFAVANNNDIIIKSNILSKMPLPYAWLLTYIFASIILFILCFMNFKYKRKQKYENNN